MIRVLIVDDSAYNRMVFSKILSQHPSIEVVDTARDGQDAIKKIARYRPDVITLDLEMPAMDGFSVLRWVMQNRPTPVLVISAKASQENVFKALELGAIDFIAKPSEKPSPLLQSLEQELIEKILAVREVKTFSQPQEIAPPPPPVFEQPTAFELVVIGSSTGGPAALQKIFMALPPLPVPIIVAQHMPPVFTQLFAERLDRIAPMIIKEARDREKVKPGTVYIGPGGHHIQVELDRKNALILRCKPKGPEDLYAPSADILFQSAAQTCPHKTIGLILTGMGSDGSRGAKALRDAGGRVFAEAESSAVVYGMPMEALRIGGAEKAIPLWEIPSALLCLLSGEDIQA